MKNKMLKKGLAIGMSAFLLASSLAPVSVQAASWKQNKTGWWWQEDNGSYPVSQWKVINGKWYAFDERGYMRSDWFLSNGKWYYLGAANDGSMKTGWQYVNGRWYYMNGDGAMLSNQWVGNYWVDASGAWSKPMESPRWVRSGSRWWYRHGDGGYTANGWEAINGRWYYFDGAGWMVTGWKLIGGSWYYMNGDGAMLANQWVGDYYVGPTGAMLTNQWVGNYYVDASGKWDPNKQQHEHDWQPVTSTVNHPAETHQELVKEAWTEEIPHEEEGHYEATIPGHWEYELVPAEGHEEEYETLDGTTDKRFVVTKRAYTKSTWVEPKTVECDETGLEVKTPMYREEERIICGGCGLDVTDDYKTDSLESHINTEALKGNDNCASTYSDYRMVQYDTRNVIYPATYVVDKEAWTETVQHEAEYKTVVDKEAWTETITKNVCSECGAVQ